MTKLRDRWFYLPILALMWGFLFAARPLWYHPWCAIDPTPCLTFSVNSFDRIVFQFGNVRADFLSNVIQNGYAVLLTIFPWLLYRREHWKRGFTETYHFIEVSLWNGVLLESCRAFVQRPRPLVFHDPMGDGANIAQYTSFYSGHTSFVALATLTLFFMVRRYRAPKWMQYNFFLLYVMSTLLTASLRVMGGRHYPTDTLGGALVGTLLALAGSRIIRFPKWIAEEESTITSEAPAKANQHKSSDI